MQELIPANPAAQTGCILIVDDEEHNRELLREILTAEGHEVTEAENGPQALAAVSQGSPDLILLDVMMPVVTGFQVCQRLKSDPATAHIPIILITSLGHREARLEGISAGANDFLSKPIDRQDVVLRVRNAIFAKHLFDQLKQSYASLRQLFGRYVSDDVAAQLAAEPNRYLRPGGERREATVLFADMRGFTTVAETIDPMAAVEILNSWLEHVVDTIFEFGGTVDKILGDGIMAVFGAPVQHIDDPYRAVACAMRIREKVENLAVPLLGSHRLHMGMGISTGVVIAGAIGSERRMDYTVIGDAVNVAQRLESIASPGQILMTDTTYDRVKHAVHASSVGSLRLKGKLESVVAFEVHAMKNIEALSPEKLSMVKSQSNV
jgi:adenylate cyclase